MASARVGPVSLTVRFSRTVLKATALGIGSTLDRSGSDWDVPSVQLLFQSRFVQRLKQLVSDSGGVPVLVSMGANMRGADRERVPDLPSSTDPDVLLFIDTADATIDRIVVAREDSWLFPEALRGAGRGGFGGGDAADLLVARHLQFREGVAILRLAALASSFFADPNTRAATEPVFRTGFVSEPGSATEAARSTLRLLDLLAGLGLIDDRAAAPRDRFADLRDLGVELIVYERSPTLLEIWDDGRLLRLDPPAALAYLQSAGESQSRSR